MPTTSLTRLRPIAAGVAATFLLLVGATAAHAITGSDRGFGYTWRDVSDGAAFENATLGSTITLNPADNAAPTFQDLAPFSFRFYGQNYTRIWISDNGWISLGPTNPGSALPTPDAVPDTTLPNLILAPFWKDLRATQIRLGPNVLGDIYIIRWTTTDPDNGNAPLDIDLLLFNDGRIKFIYRHTAPLTIATVGIEQQDGTDGIAIAAGGVPVTGVAITPFYTIEFLPPPILPTLCGTFTPIACGTTNGSTPGNGPGVRYYGCVFSRFLTTEQIYQFTLAAPAVVDMRLSATTQHTLFLLETCNERQCIAGPVTALNMPLAPGTYYIAVDSVAAFSGTFTLTITCTTLGEALACGNPDADTTAGPLSPRLFDIYPCEGSNNIYDGPEHFYSLNLAAATNIRADLTPNGPPFPALDVFILRTDPGEITEDDCVAWGGLTDRAVAWDAQPGSYLIVVDGINGAQGGYTLATSCQIFLDCSSIDGVIDFAGGPVFDVAGDTADGVNRAEVYGCESNLVHDGPEDVYEIVLTEPGHVGVVQQTGSEDLSFFILSSCNEGACYGFAGERGCGPLLQPGTHYLVVDGVNGNAGPYTASVNFEQVFNRWDACENPLPPTDLADTSNSTWNFDDQAFCISVPASHNYPDGCTFAMYLTAPCGTELHVPLYDVEGGHLRIFDIFRGQYVFLNALSTGGWSDSGTEIQWQDADCVNGSDSRWNNQTTDISFRRPEGLCGVYRLEFINHSGFVWELYSNCSGSRTPGFNIHDSYCTALEDYNPLPNVSITSATATFDCPEITVNYTLRNDGCQTAENFELNLTDAGQPVGTEIVTVPAGESVSGSFTATFTQLPTSDVQLQADRPNVTLECNEAAGLGCGGVVGAELVFLPGCANTCQVVAQATATPTRICAGDSATIDAGNSTASLCPSGLEYRLAPSPMFQSSPTFIVTPGVTTNYDVEVQCVGDPLCDDTVRVTVTVDQLPVIDPLTVVATDLSSCNRGIRLTWGAATFPSGAGGYTLYRSQVSCADALVNPDLQFSLTGTTFDDTTTVGDETYYYVLEAEDSLANTTCVPQGPRNTGSVRRVDFSQGTCTPITDLITPRPDLLPRVGESLRLGGGNGGLSPTYGSTFVELSWTTDRPLNLLADEHFHILRANDDPSGVFPQLNIEPPRRTQLTYTDFGAAHPPSPEAHVFYYLVFVADACDADNRDFDSFGTTRP